MEGKEAYPLTIISMENTNHDRFEEPSQDQSICPPIEQAVDDNFQS